MDIIDKNEKGGVDYTKSLENGSLKNWPEY